MKWIIENMKRNIDNGLVIEVAYRVVKMQGATLAEHRGKVTLTGDPNVEGFVPFEQLTEPQVIQWVKDSVDVSGIEANVQGLLDEKVANITAKGVKTGLPWDNKKRLSWIP